MCGIGLIGASGTGKTTLAKEITRVTGVPFIQSQARAVHKSLGIDVNKSPCYELAMEAQKKILEVSEQQYKSIEGIFISDRTPIDFASYAMAQTLAHNLSERQTRDVIKYVDECYRVTNMYFSSVILIQPSFKIFQEEGRANNEAYAQHINMIMTGMVADPSNRIFCAKHFLKKSITDLKTRVDLVIKIASLVEINNMKQGSLQTHH